MDPFFITAPAKTDYFGKHDDRAASLFPGLAARRYEEAADRFLP
jgi:hypothetical protein